MYNDEELSSKKFIMMKNYHQKMYNDEELSV